MVSEKRVVNLPNGLTLFRIAVLPLLAVLIVRDERWWALVVMVIAGVTDILDGWAARKYREESSFGKLMDPVADKILVCVAIVFLAARYAEPIDPWLGTLLLAREFLITGLRAVAASSGLVLPAGRMGKWKAAIQMVGLGAMIIGEQFPGLPARPIGLVLLWFSVLLSYWSMVSYLKLVYQKLASEP